MQEIKLKYNSLFEIDGKIFENDVDLYKCQDSLKKEFELRSKAASDCKVSLQINAKQAYFSLNDNKEEIQWLEVPLKARETVNIPIYLKPGDKSGENYVYIEAEADYCLLVEKKITIDTKESSVPKPLFKFEFIADAEKYYIGEGRRKIGRLTVKTSEQTDVQNPEAYGVLELKDLSCSNDCIHITPTDDVLSLGESKEYEIDFCSREESEEEEAEVSFRFSLGGDNSKEYTIYVKKRQDPIKEKKFLPIKDLRFDTLKESHIVGYLNTRVINTDQRGYFKRENGYFELTDGVHSFDDKGESKKLALELGNNTYPIYANIEKLFGSIRENIDDDKSFHIECLSYSDNIIDNEIIDAEYSVNHIKACPISYISVIDAFGKELPIEGQKKIILDKWEYDSNDATQVASANIFSLRLSNNQSLAYRCNGIIWKDIHIEGEGIIVPNIPQPEIEIKNGEQNVQIPIKIKFDEIKNKSELKVSFKCQEIINDTDNDADVVGNNSRNIECEIVIPIMEVVVNDWYSIDLGTTGIVVAKWNYESETDDFDGISALELKDSEKPIERSKNIVSSITILKPFGETNIGEIVVAPSTTELKQSAKHVLVPTKFMVGQEVLPFIDTYRRTFPEGLKLGSDTYAWEEITPQKIIEYTYNTIFSKISEDECNKIRKLIITYPNTYTPQALEWLRNTILSLDIFQNLSEQHLHFIPESDSVVAYYVKKSMERETNEATENVVIYDMGAGTLDLSYVKIFVEQVNGKRVKKSIIEKRIGIPVAGDYFSYLIYEDFKAKFVKGTKANYTTKDWVENFKKKYGQEAKLGNIKFENETIIDSSYADEEIKLGDAINRWINICTTDVFVQLFGNDEWYNMVDRIVLSGRGSQFKPIQDKLKELVKDRHIILDLETISSSELKQCVAEGAILYQKIFENSSMPFSILHRNSYERIGIKYRVLDENFTKKWVYKELMTEADLIWDECIDGAFFARVPSLDIKDLDFRLDDEIVFYLTTLSEEEMRKVIQEPGSGKEAFMNELFRFKPRVLTGTGDREKCVINLSIDSNNVLKISINSMDLLPHSTLPNVEDDQFFVKCNWYFNN